MQLSLSGYIFEEGYKKQLISLKDFIKLAAKAGYDAVQLRNTQISIDASYYERKQIFELVRSEGLFISCLTARRIGKAGSDNEKKEIMNKYIKLCTDMECSMIKVSGDVEFIKWAADQASKYGITITANNHIGGNLETISGTLDEIKAVNRKNYGIMYDPYHLVLTNQDYIGCIDKLASYTKNILVHICRKIKEGEKADYHYKDKTSWVADYPDAKGVQDFRTILSKFKQNGYDGVVTLFQDSSGSIKDKIHFIEYSAKALKYFWKNNK